MRVYLSLLSAAVALAGPAATAAVFPSGPQHVAVSEADALAKCGARPTAPGTWTCVGQPDLNQASAHASATGGGGAGRITWTWVKSGVTAHDSWSAPT